MTTMEGNIIKPLVIKLNELPKDLRLSDNLITQLYNDTHKLIGFIKCQPSYQQFNQHIIEQINQQITKLNDIIDMFHNYETITKDIEALITTLTKNYQEFISLETIQYKLIASNFNQEFQKQKFKKLITNNHEKSIALVNDVNFNDLNFNDFEMVLKKFKTSRKVYHLRNEKLNRWNEERVTGFI